MFGTALLCDRYNKSFPQSTQAVHGLKSCGNTVQSLHAQAGSEWLEVTLSHLVLLGLGEAEPYSEILFLSISQRSVEAGVCRKGPYIKGHKTLTKC